MATGKLLRNLILFLGWWF